MIISKSEEKPLELPELTGGRDWSDPEVPLMIRVKKVEVIRDKEQFEEDWKNLKRFQLLFVEEGQRRAVMPALGFDPPELTEEEREVLKKERKERTEKTFVERFLNSFAIWVPIVFLMGFGLIMMLLTPVQVFELINIRLYETYGKRTMTVNEIGEQMGIFLFGEPEERSGSGAGAIPPDAGEAAGDDEGFSLFGETAGAEALSDPSEFTTWLPYIIALGSVIFIIQIKMGLGALIKEWPRTRLWINLAAGLLAAVLLFFWTQTVLQFEQEKATDFQGGGFSSVVEAQKKADRLISQAVAWVLPVEVILTALLLTSGLSLFTRWRAGLEKSRHWEYSDDLERRIRSTYDHITKLEQDLQVIEEAEKLAGNSTLFPGSAPSKS